MDCNSCREQRRELEPVPYIVHEKAMARNERLVRRLVSALMAVIVLLVATVGLFVWYLNQYDYASSSIEYMQDGAGVNIIGNQNGVDYNGTTADGADAHP